jgi:hypothetical protein
MVVGREVHRWVRVDETWRKNAVTRHFVQR